MAAHPILQCFAKMILIVLRVIRVDQNRVAERNVELNHQIRLTQIYWEIVKMILIVPLVIRVEQNLKVVLNVD